MATPFTITAHAWRRWQERAPRGLNTRRDLHLVLATGRRYPLSPTVMQVVGLGMVLVVRQDRVITCWRVRSSRAKAPAFSPEAEEGV